MFNGLVSLPWWGYIAVTLVLTHITIVSVTLYLHRCQAHCALKLHPLLSHFFPLLVMGNNWHGDKRMGCDTS